MRECFRGCSLFDLAVVQTRKGPTQSFALQDIGVHVDMDENNVVVYMVIEILGPVVHAVRVAVGTFRSWGNIFSFWKQTHCSEHAFVSTKRGGAMR